MGGIETGKQNGCVAASVWGKGVYNNNALIQSFRGTEYALSEKVALFLYRLLRAKPVKIKMILIL